MSRVGNPSRGDDGASAVEYGLIIVAIAAIIAGIVFALGSLTRSQFSSTCSAWDTAAHTSAC